MPLFAFTASAPLRIHATRFTTAGRLSHKPKSRAVTVQERRIQSPSSMFNWLRKATSGTSEKANIEDMRHTVLNAPLIPPGGAWQPPMQQATFGLGW